MDDNEQLTAEEQAALDAQRGTPESEAPEQPAVAPETPQEGAGAPEGQEGGEPPPEDGKRPQMVPHAALHQERTRRQEIERQAAEDRRKYEARFEELLKLVPQPAAAAPPAQTPAFPDPQQDPAGYIIADMQQKGASIEQINQRIATFEQQQQQQQVVAAVQQRAAAMEAEYKAENPEYDNAMIFLKSARDRELQVIGITDPAMRAQQIQAEAFQIAVSALQQGGNPAERLHRLAEARGWQKPAGEQTPGVQAPQAAPVAGVPDQAARLRMVQQGQEQSRGLGNVRGNGPAPMTAQKLLDMDDDAFLETMKKSKDARRLMGA